jgi:hypothetical protein
VAYPVRVARAADLDHDGDADLVIGADASPAVRIWRNSGGRLDFEATTPGLDGIGAARDLACTDLDGDHRTDLVCVDRVGRVRILLQSSDAAFIDASANAGMAQERARVVAAADVDGDGWTDLLLGNDTGLWVYANRGGSCFVRAASYRAPQSRYYSGAQPRVAVAAVCLDDLDNDGLLDALTLHPRLAQSPPPAVVVASQQTPAGKPGSRAEDAAPEPPLALGALPSDLRAWRHDGRGVLLDATLQLELSGDTLLPVVPVSADFDGDGDVDVACVHADSTVVVKWNRGGNVNRRLLVELAGPQGLRDGRGARLEIHSGGVVRSLEVGEQPVWTGIQAATRLQALRIVWPDGVAQNDLDIDVPPNGRVRWAKRP